MSMYIDIHVLQSVPPSNLNRDDTGSPKSATYGGVRRARVSSQAWKRAARKAFDLDPAHVGYRTTRIVQLVADRIVERDPESGERAVALATEVVKALGLDPKPPRTSKRAEAAGEVDTVPRSEYLVFFSAAQIDKVAEFALASGDTIDKKQAKALVSTDHGVDVSLFGRMIADDATLNVDAAVQVAHAISTHAVVPEYDFYTAVDDKNPHGETGAGMIGTLEFNSATLYRYATVNVAALERNLGSREATARAAEVFVKSFVSSMPTGKQNSFGNRTLPEAVVVMVREDQPVNLVAAFETPITTDTGGYLAGSAHALRETATSVAEAYGVQPAATYVVTASPQVRSELDGLGESRSLDDLVAEVGDRIRS